MAVARGALSCIALTACGRIGFDAQTGFDVVVGLEFIQVTAPERFALVFDAGHHWQVGAWFDLESAASVNLVDRAPDVQHSVLFGPLLVKDGVPWWDLDNATTSGAIITRDDPDRIVVETTWVWKTAIRDLSVVTVHDIDLEGTWQLDVTMTSANTQSLPDHEYCDSHVLSTLAWSVTQDPDEDWFAFTRSVPVPPRARLLVQRAPGTAGRLTSDELGNRYWNGGSISLDPMFHVAWTATIWPPER